LPEYLIWAYCPFDFAETQVTVTAESEEEARRRIIGRVASCPNHHSFKVEEWFIISVYTVPPKPPLERPPYETPPLEKKPPRWLMSARVVEEKPLPVGAKPVGHPKLVRLKRVGELTYLIYRQEVRSPKYPELTFHIEFSRPFFTKFMEEAKRLKKARKIREAIYYLIEREPALPTFMIADILGLGYWTVYRHITELIGEGKVMVAPRRWRGFIMYIPTKPRKEEDILSELMRMKTLELGRTLTSEELEVLEKAARRRRRRHLQQKILTWMGEAPEKVSYTWVKFLKYVGKFKAADYKTYGPYKPGEVAKIPTPNAAKLARAEAVTLI